MNECIKKLCCQLFWGASAAWCVFSIPLAMADTVKDLPARYSNPNKHGNTGQGVGSIELKVVLPDMYLTRQDGSKAKIPNEFDDGKPVVLTFIYTSCKAVCPIMSHVMKGVQDKLGDQANKIHMVSITLDPEFDTPERLTEYAHQLEAGPQWIHYTGLNSDIVKLERAFDIYRGDKMNHLTVFFVRRAPGEPWIKFVGFVSPDSIINELGLETKARS
jgi:protein SCO1/2